MLNDHRIDFEIVKDIELAYALTFVDVLPDFGIEHSQLARCSQGFRFLQYFQVFQILQIIFYSCLILSAGFTVESLIT